MEKVCHDGLFYNLVKGAEPESVVTEVIRPHDEQGELVGHHTKSGRNILFFSRASCAQREEVPVDVQACRFACSRCKSYMKNWSCPGAGLKAEFQNIDTDKEYFFFWYLKLRADKWVQNFGDNWFLALNQAERLMSSISLNLLYRIESQMGYPGLSFGNCRYCAIHHRQKCAMVEGKKCAYPENMRKSLESTGVVVNDLLKKFMEEELYWRPHGVHSFPPYMLKVCGIFVYEVDLEKVCSAYFNSLSQNMYVDKLREEAAYLGAEKL